MSEEEHKLNELSDFFKRMSNKIKLVKLITQAKNEYDKYDLKSGYKALEEAYRLDKTNPTILRGFGCFKQAEGNYEEAIEFFKKALEYSSAKEVEYSLIGMAYYLQEKLDEAVKYFNLAIDANDNYDKAYEGRNQAMLENHLKIIDLQESLKKYF